MEPAVRPTRAPGSAWWVERLARGSTRCRRPADESTGSRSFDQARRITVRSDAATEVSVESREAAGEDSGWGAGGTGREQ